jgi:hypothetical protein
MLLRELQPASIDQVIREEDIVDAAPRKVSHSLLLCAAVAVAAEAVSVVGGLQLVGVLQQPGILQACNEVHGLQVPPTHSARRCSQLSRCPQLILVPHNAVEITANNLTPLCARAHS